MTKTLLSADLESPVGALTLVGSDDGLRAVLWPVEKPGRVTFAEPVSVGEHSVLSATANQLEDYFAGRRQCFDLPLDPVGTDFQLRVWTELSKIGFGQTTSYGELASSIGKPSASRAVGSATGRNPISVVVPCHRLISSSGKLTGFAGGLKSKEWLLRHEASTLF